FTERRGDTVKRAAELAFDHRAVNVEGNSARHVENELVALALDVDTGAGRALAQLLFLLVHIIADACARDRADTCTDDFLGPAVLAADQVAEQIAAEGAADAADGGLRNFLLAG